jgi:hypothetical protein
MRAKKGPKIKRLYKLTDLYHQDALFFKATIHKAKQPDKESRVNSFEAHAPRQINFGI